MKALQDAPRAPGQCLATAIGGVANLASRRRIDYSRRISPVIVVIPVHRVGDHLLFGLFFTVYFFDRLSPMCLHWPPISPEGIPYERPWFVASESTPASSSTSSFTMHWATESVK